MPYNRETASKGGHSDFVRNPDVQNFLAACEYMKPPTDEEAEALAAEFIDAPNGPPVLPNFVVASDASKSDAPINDKLPSTQLGFIKVSHILVSLDKYAELIDPKTRFVDPFKAASLHRNAKSITYVLPGSNIKYQGAIKGFGNKVRELRIKRGMTIEAFANSFSDVDMHVTQLSRIERGETNPTISTIFLIAGHLGVKPKDLIDFD